ncbi:MAG: NAD(P)/FAD-dependent oxidoreductase, partial [Bacteroidota bacterium]
MQQQHPYAIIGAGPSGLCMAKNLKDAGIPFIGFEASADVGGLWNIENEYSTVYESAHLISSKTRTEFASFPMSKETADYPSHRELCQYFKDYASEFGLYDDYRFNAKVVKTTRTDDHWIISLESGEDIPVQGLCIANGTLSHPNIPTFKGTFDGEFFHSCTYKNSDVFAGKRVLIIGAGNSGCDIAVDAVHRAKKVAMSVRRGYHFVPKYIFGKPADAVGGMIKLPRKLKQRIDTKILKWFTGNPEAFGFPKPDHAIYESHPIVNSLVLYYAGHGDIEVKKDIDRFDGKMVHFVDGHSEEFDLVLLATGYKLNYPFIDQSELNWEGTRPKLFLNIFHPESDDVFVLGLIEAAGIGWEGRNEMAKLVTAYIKAKHQNPHLAEAFKKIKGSTMPDM